MATNTTNINYPRGSEWRKWDLHIHTPASGLANQYNNDWDIFVKVLFTTAIQQNVAVLGITDYFTIEGYEKIINDYIKNESKLMELFETKEMVNKVKSILLLPNIEFRLDKIVDQNRVNYHVIFSDNVEIDDIKENFLQEIEFVYEAVPFESDNCRKLTKHNLEVLGQKIKSEQTTFKGSDFEVGCTTAIVKDEQIRNILEKHADIFKGKFLIAVPVDEDLSKVRWDNQGHQFRKVLYQQCNFFFSSNSSTIEFGLGKKHASQNDYLKEFKTFKPCVIGCDAHSIEAIESKLGKHWTTTDDTSKITWIKADPTFEGLKQVLEEPENRVFIGAEPSLLTNIKKNRTKYIKELTIDGVEGYSGAQGKWFEKVKIPFNPELVAIIGNKGNGKSAISDILAYCCRTNMQDYFSFLKDDKFWSKNLANNFKAIVTFEDDSSASLDNLSKQKPQSDIPLVKYIPQGYFESICNDLQKEGNLKAEIENVVFQYIDESMRLGASSFKELVSKKSEAIDNAIQQLKIRLSNINSRIIELEDKAHPSYRKIIDDAISVKENEIKALVKPTEVQKPNEDDENTKSIVEKITSLKNENRQLEESISTLKNEKNKILLDISQIDTFTEDLKRLVNEVDEYIKNKDMFIQEMGIHVDKLLSIKLDLSIITQIKASKEKRLNELISLLRQEDNGPANSPVNKLNKNSAEIIKLQNSLDGPNQAYQAYIHQKDEYEQQQKKIIGDENTPNTLSWLNKEKTYLNEGLSSDLEQQKEERSKCLSSIYNKRKEIIEIYRQIKERIDSIIDEHSSLLDSYEIKIDASFGIRNSFSTDFLRFVNQSKSGSFRGSTAGENLVQNVLRDSEIQTEDGILAFCNKFIELLEKEGDNDRNISDQVDNRQDLYDYLFSIDYLTYDYSIKQGDKDLSLLSPGEKGALLLVFYLLLDMDQKPLILDQPEDNLDNDSVANILVNFIQAAKKKRQIIMVTHNPNLAVVADAEQIIYANIDKKNNNTFSVVSGSIENPEMNKHIVDVLEGAMPAFKKRDHKYQEQR